MRHRRFCASCISACGRAGCCSVPTRAGQGSRAGDIWLQLSPDATLQDKSEASKLGHGETHAGLLCYTAFMVGSRDVPREAAVGSMELDTRYLAVAELKR